MTPPDAMTSVMADFGMLVDDSHSYNQPEPLPSRAESAARIREQVKDFVLGMVRRLFGSKLSSKLHEVLCHAAEETELRKDISMADTCPKEQIHKQEKAAPRRTNRHTGSVSLLLLTVAQSRILLQEDENQFVAERQAALDESMGGGFGGPRVPLDVLSQRPGLVALVWLLGVPKYAFISILTGVHFFATYEWQVLSSLELLKSSESYSCAAWHDFIKVRRRPSKELLFRGVLLIVARTSVDLGEPCAVVQCMDVAEPIEGGPLATAGHEKLVWASDAEEAAWPTLNLVPLSDVQRIARVIPDVQTLGPYGIVTPLAVGIGAAAGGLRSQVFLNNISFKSTTPSQQQAEDLRRRKVVAAAALERTVG